MDMQHLNPDRSHQAPIFMQLYQRYRDAINTGKLQPGDRIPSVRSLASELNLARGTVERAYQMLTSEGYFLARGPAGTVISPQLQGLAVPASGATTTVSEKTAARAQTVAVGPPRALQLGLPALDAFPRKTWVRLAAQNLRSLDGAAMSYPDAQGHAPLRRAIAAYLGVSRGIACSHEQIFVTAGYRSALELICRTLLKPGATGWYEDPGYIFARQFLQYAGMRLVPVPVDEEGLNVATGQERDAKARFAVVTPTHQSPLGMAMSLPRRLQLLDWASRARAWIIEDDYDSEFRYHGQPLAPLKSLDRDGRVLYTGTFSKALFPGLGLAYLVVPVSQVERFRAAADTKGGPGSLHLQATVATFMEQGHFARHLRKMRALYAARRGYLVDALLQRFDGRLHVQSQAGGIHLLAKLTRRESDRSLAEAARADGLAIAALSQWQIRRSGYGGLLMGFANVTDPTMASTLTKRLQAALRSG